MVVAHGFQPGFAGRGLQDPIPVAREVQVDEVGDVGLVVDDDDGPSFHGAIVARRRTRPCEGTVSGT